jgi:hemoglobin-like flavoprotein
MLNSTHKALVQETWKQVLPASAQVAELFYGRLFVLDPTLTVLFKGDMQEQGRKLMSTLGLAVASLDDLDRLLPALQSLGRRHVGYGVREEHYGTVAEALLWTLKVGLGERATPEVLEAWAEVYGVVSSVMLEAAESGEPAK